jgi:toxin ParE1/3/4
MKINRSRQADEDLIGIWLYIAADNPAAADVALDRIESVCNLLAENPHIGRERPDIAPGLRYFPVEKYLILYRVEDATVEIVRVLHGARKIDELF